MFDELAYQQRFGGIARLYGVDALRAFSSAEVLVIGIGGVGTWVTEALARSGIGRLALMDLDDVCVTNSNRQIHALASTIGQSKVAVMAERVMAINPLCQVRQIEDLLTPDNLVHYLPIENGLPTEKVPDFVVDCIDSVKPKAALIAWCKRYKIPLVTVGGAGGQLDPTLIQVADLAKTYQDPLLAKVRNLLRRQYNFTKNPERRFGVDAVFSAEQLKYPQADGSVCQTKDGLHGSMRMDCAAGFGATTVVTGSFGFVAASRVLQRLAQRAAIANQKT